MARPRSANTQKNEAIPESRWRTARISMRVHPDLKDALDFLADAERRTLSQVVEWICLNHVRTRLRNRFENDGALADDEKKEFSLRDLRRR